MNIGLHFSKCEMAGSYGKSMFNFLKELLNIFFTTAVAILHSHQHLMKILVSSHPCKHLAWAIISMLVFLHELICHLGASLVVSVWNILPNFLFNGLLLIIKFWGSFIGSIFHWQMSSNCLTVLARTSCEIWKRSGGRPCLAPDLRGETINLSYLGWHQL